jgi:peptidoglycan/LPS O-acetylase OafA/YrhL
MIQRIQSVWLLIAALINSGLFYFDLYRGHIITNGVDMLVHLRVNDHFPSLLLALVIVLLPFIAIFLFKNRKQQRGLAMLSIVAVIGFIALMVMRVGNFNNQSPAPTNCTYWIGAVLPIISIIFIIMAMNGIRKDEKLVKSLDRLR